MPLAEHDRAQGAQGSQGARFNSRAPRGARRQDRINGQAVVKFQFTCPSRSTTSHVPSALRSERVSIHVPLAEHDGLLRGLQQQLPGFNSRAPRGARLSYVRPTIRFFSFNSRAPRGARQGCAMNYGLPYSFNSRAPRGARRKREVQYGTATQFQFTCPSRSTTNPTLIADRITVVSIHVPLAEHDVMIVDGSKHFEVSIHVPLAEHDMALPLTSTTTSRFNSDRKSVV